MSEKIAVNYLAYVPLGPSYLKRFLQSLKRYPPECDYCLNIVFNGSEDDGISAYDQILSEIAPSPSVFISPRKFDISTYFWLAQQLTNRYLLFLNTYSEVLDKNWLLFYKKAIELDNVGVVGSSSAGWRGEYYRYINNDGPVRTFGQIKSRYVMWSNFRKFYGPHIRTNAFCIKRSVFLSLNYEHLQPTFVKKWLGEDSKLRTLLFENGNKNMTNQIRNLGLQPVVVGKCGKIYYEDEWAESNTFWNGDQENLIIQDNQTLRYKNGSEEDREYLREWAWGTR